MLAVRFNLKANKKSRICGSFCLLGEAWWLSAGNLAGLEALGADVLLEDMAVFDNGNLLHVGCEHAVGDAMRMADVATGDRCLTADFTNFGHNTHSITYQMAICI